MFNVILLMVGVLLFASLLSMSFFGSPKLKLTANILFALLLSVAAVHNFFGHQWLSMVIDLLAVGFSCLAAFRNRMILNNEKNNTQR